MGYGLHCTVKYEQVTAMSIYDAQLEETLRKVEGGADVLAARKQRPARHIERPAPTEAAHRIQEEGRLMRLEQEGKLSRGTGKLPEYFWDLPLPEDPDGSIRRAV